MEYALINLVNNEILEKRSFSEQPPDISQKGVRWLPIITTRPPCDTDSQVEEGPFITVTSDQVTIVYTIRTLTQEQLKQKLYERIDSQLFGKDIFIGQFLLLVYNEFRQSQNKLTLSKNEFINMILETKYFALDTEENLIEYDKSGNPIE